MRLLGLNMKVLAEKVRIQAFIKSRTGGRHLWFEFDQRFMSYLTVDRYDGFVLFVLHWAARRREPIFIEGKISEKLYKNLQFFLKAMVTFNPGFKNVFIASEGLIRGDSNARKAVGAYLSADLEFLATLRNRFDVIKYLLYLHIDDRSPSNAGTVDNELPGIKASTVEKAACEGKELVTITSNLDKVIGSEWVQLQSSGFIALGTALLLQGLISKYYMPADDYFGDQEGTIPTIFPDQLLLNESVEVIRDRSRFDRASEMERLAEFETTKYFMEFLEAGMPEDEVIPSIGMAPSIESMPDLEAMEPELQEKYRIITTDFDISVILPFYKKYKDFVRVLPRNARYLSRTGVEVIIVMDESSEEEKLLNLIRQYPEICWKVIVNDNLHEWRNPSRVLNVGIQCACKSYVLVISPESEMATDIMLQFRMKLNGSGNFCIGQVHFLEHHEKRFFLKGVPYGSIMVIRENLIKIGGYDESLDRWGGDDDNLRIRLKMSGVIETFVPEAHVLHREDKEDEKSRPSRKSPIPGTPLFQRIYHPCHWLANEGDFGHDFDRVAFDYSKRISVQVITPTPVVTRKQCRLDLGKWSIRQVEQLLSIARQIEDSEKRLVFIATQFIGTPFSFESSLSFPEKGILPVRLSAFDCITFEYYMLALNLATDFDGFIDCLARLRYKNPENLGIDSDPVKGNILDFTFNILLVNAVQRGYVKNMTGDVLARANVQPGLLSRKLKSIVRPDAYGGGRVIPKYGAKDVDLFFIKPEHIDRVSRFILSGDLILFVLPEHFDRPKTIFGHSAIAVKGRDLPDYMRRNINLPEDETNLFFMHATRSRDTNGRSIGVNFAGQETHLDSLIYDCEIPRLLSHYCRGVGWQGIVVIRPLSP